MPVYAGAGDPTAKYKISDRESGNPAYYGFIAADGAWYIIKETSEDYRYAKGESGYVAAYGSKSGLSYDIFNNTF